MDLNRVEYVFEVDDDEINVVAMLDDIWVGRAEGTRAGDWLTLEDVHIREDDNLPMLMVKQFGTLRDRGIGTELLKRFLDRADSEGIVEIRGKVTRDDLGKNRDLLGWYRRHGFVVMEPDGEYLVHAEKQIVRRR